MTDVRMKIVEGDITKLAADTIMNAANESLPGSGADEAKITNGYVLAYEAAMAAKKK